MVPVSEVHGTSCILSLYQRFRYHIRTENRLSVSSIPIANFATRRGKKRVQESKARRSPTHPPLEGGRAFRLSIPGIHSDPQDRRSDRKPSGGQTHQLHSGSEI